MGQTVSEPAGQKEGYRTLEGEQLEKLVIELDEAGRHEAVEALLVEADALMSQGVAEVATDVTAMTDTESPEPTAQELIDEVTAELDWVVAYLDQKNRKRVLQGIQRVEGLLERLRMDVQTDPDFDRGRKGSRS